MRVADALPRMGQPLRGQLEFTPERKRCQGVKIQALLAVGTHLGHWAAIAPRL